MQTERWQQVEKLFHAALERTSHERLAYLRETSSGDLDLQREVESLLAAHEASGSLETAGSDLAAEWLKGRLRLVGQTLRHFQILEHLGSGGMGDVYLAEDNRLHRKVALKLLPDDSAREESQLRRFEREALAASALNHPNIVTIYEIDEADGTRFIATEFVAGQTLRALMTDKRLEPAKALDIAEQTAKALEAAHAAGIIHRDIKPENIMVRSDGLVKVLDFGLAKLIGPQPATVERHTLPGMVLGSVAYMSPEQARGLDLDARTDIFSLGIVLYEMLAGQAPFQGLTRSDVLAALLKTDPPPLSDYLPDVPGELEEVVCKALCKDREERYQTILELQRDLRTLQQKLEKGDWFSGPAGSGESEAEQAEGGADWKRLRRDSESKQPAAFVRVNNQPAPELPVDAKNLERQLAPGASATVAQSQKNRRGLLASLRWLAISALAMLLVAALSYLLLFRGAPTAVSPVIKSLAVLPFRSLNQEAKENYLGLGIATDIITKVSQSSEVTVRPTSAVRKYVNQEMDALAAARELKVDAVLDSTYLQVGEQLRVTVNLLRVEDGASLWADKFDERFTGIFAIQDKVSQQVAQRLRLRLSPAQQARLTKRYTSNLEAYNYYATAMYHSGSIGPDPRTRPESDLAVDLFKKAIELDPQYALAHAQLGYAHSRIAVFQEDNPALIEQAKQELGVAERLDPQLADVYEARYFIEFSQYEGWQVEPAIRQLRLAQQLDPNAGHSGLADVYHHIGLEQQAVEEFEIALKVDPNDDRTKEFYVQHYYQSARPDEGLEANKRLFNRGPDWRYYLEKRMMKEAAPLVEQEHQKDPGSPWKFGHHVLLLALRGNHQEALAAVPSILKRERRYRGYHHGIYNIARIYALGGKSEEALKWLRVTVKEGFPCYPLFARDSMLDRIRQDPAFIQFLAEMKELWEGYQREFG